MRNQYEIQIVEKKATVDYRRVYNDIVLARKAVKEISGINYKGTYRYDVEAYLNGAKNKLKQGLSFSRRLLREHLGHDLTLRHKSSGFSITISLENRLGISSTLKETKEALLYKVREQRRERKARNSYIHSQYVGNQYYRYERIGNMIAPGELKRLGLEIKSNAVFTSKKPLTDERHVGVEIEFIAPQTKADLGIMLVEAGLSKYVTLKGDGSIRVNREDCKAFELAVCIPESERKVILAKVTEVLKKAEALVNKSCGLHVHLDMRSRDRKKSFSNLVSAQNVFYAMNPKSRKESSYCKKTLSKNFDKESRGGRYKGVNATAAYKYGTLEVRIHAGTVDDIKINNWVDILISVTDSETPFKRAPRTIDSFCKGYNISAELRAYIIERIRKFNGGAEISEVGEVA